MKWTAEHDFIIRLMENLIGKPRCFPNEGTATKNFVLLAS